MNRGFMRGAVIVALGVAGSGGGCRWDDGAYLPLPADYHVVTIATSTQSLAEPQLVDRELMSMDLRGHSAPLGRTGDMQLLVDDWLIRFDFDSGGEILSTYVARVGSGEPLRPVAVPPGSSVAFSPLVLDDHLVFRESGGLKRYRSVPLTFEGEPRWLTEPGEKSFGYIEDSSRLVVSGPDGLLLVDVRGRRELISTGPSNKVSVDSKSSRIAWVEGAKILRYHAGRSEEVGSSETPLRRIEHYDRGRYLALVPAESTSPVQLVDTRHAERSPLEVPPGPRLMSVQDGVAWVLRDGDAIALDAATGAERGRFPARGYHVLHPTQHIVAMLTRDGLAIAHLDRGLTILDDEGGERAFWTKSGRRLVWRVAGADGQVDLKTYDLFSGEVRTVGSMDVFMGPVSLPDEVLVYLQGGRVVMNRLDASEVAVLSPEDHREYVILGAAAAR